MNNTTILPNTAKRMHRNLATTLAILAVVFAVFFIVVYLNDSKVSIANTTFVDGIVTDITVDTSDGEGEYLITLQDQSTYSICPVISSHISQAEINSIMNCDVRLYLCKLFSDISIVGIESASYNLSADDGISYIKANNQIGLIVLGMSTLVMISLAILFFVLFKRAKHQIEKDILEILTYIAPPATPQRQKYIKKSVISILAIFVIGVVSLVYIGSIYQETTPFFISLGVFCILFITALILMLALLPKIRQQDIETYHKTFDFKYNPNADNLNDYQEDISEGLIYKFTDTKLIFDVDEMVNYFEDDIKEANHYNDIKSTNEFDKDSFIDIIKDDIRKEITENGFNNMCFDYNELNFYTKVVFRPTGATSVYICSALTESTKQYLTKDIIFELNNNLYNYIKKYNIPVKGLDYFLKNNLELMQKHCKGKSKHISFTQ